MGIWGCCRKLDFSLGSLTPVFPHFTSFFYLMINFPMIIVFVVTLGVVKRGSWDGGTMPSYDQKRRMRTPIGSLRFMWRVLDLEPGNLLLFLVWSLIFAFLLSASLQIHCWGCFPNQGYDIHSRIHWRCGFHKKSGTGWLW